MSVPRASLCPDLEKHPVGFKLSSRHPLHSEDRNLFHSTFVLLDLGKWQIQHNSYIKVLKSEGLDIHYFELPLPNVVSIINIQYENYSFDKITTP